MYNPMPDTPANRIVTVFGDTRFVGRRVIKHCTTANLGADAGSFHSDIQALAWGSIERRVRTCQARGTDRR
jgi:hypothetical protein